MIDTNNFNSKGLGTSKEEIMFAVEFLLERL